jgi:hypothetical protein
MYRCGDVQEFKKLMRKDDYFRPWHFRKQYLRNQLDLYVFGPENVISLELQQFLPCGLAMNK